MNRQELEDFHTLVRSPNTLANLFFVHRPSPRDYRLEFGAISPGVEEEFRNALAAQLDAILWEEVDTEAPEAEREPRDFQPVPYDPAVYVEPPQYAVADLGDLPVWQMIAAEMAANDDSSPPPTIDARFLKHLWAYGVRFDNGCGFYFRRFTPAKVLRSSSWFNLVYVGNTLSTIQEDVFHLDSKIDVVILCDEAMILQKTLFEQVFSMDSEYKARVSGWIRNRLCAAEIIDDCDAFIEACERHVRRAKKLVSIASSMDFKKLGRARVQLHRVADEMETGIEFDARDRIVFDEGQTDTILVLLADDLLESPLTKLHYEALSKRKFPRRPPQLLRWPMGA